MSILKNQIIINISKFASLFLLLVFSILAMALPYHIELILGLSFIAMIGYGFYIFLQREDKTWDYIISIAILLVSFISSLLFIVLHIYPCYYIAIISNFALIVLVVTISLSYVRQNLVEHKLMKRIGLTTFSFLTLAVALLGAISHLGYSRSVSATVATLVTRWQKVSDEKAEADYQKKTSEEKIYTLNSAIIDVPYRKEVMSTWDVYFFNNETNYQNVIFYIHGGYYIAHTGEEQLKTMCNIAKNTNSLLVMPIYPLAPFSTAETNYPIMKNIYETVVNNNVNKKIILTGESAGGGFALALAESLTTQPDELILFSPWVDVSMSNPDAGKIDDPMLTITMSKLCGKAWAGNLALDDYRVSPLYGDVSKLKNVTIYTGTKEIFYPDINKVIEKLKNNNIKLETHIGTNMIHTYPFYQILEGRQVVEEIIKKVNNNANI